MTVVIKEAYVQGLSTRSVDDPVKMMGIPGVSKRQVSRLCGEIDERAEASLARWKGNGLASGATPPASRSAAPAGT
ncbi:transposase [Fluviibacterium sp. DFM31]|uniref:Transposase n=1 Tax=Meridianimarinicoccus marinus TaxID=3231483 RepID=A0ABV3LF41_9RHOB